MIKGCIKEEDLSAFTDGELSGPKSRRVEEHLENCLECRETGGNEGVGWPFQVFYRG